MNSARKSVSKNRLELLANHQLSNKKMEERLHALQSTVSINCLTILQMHKKEGQQKTEIAILEQKLAQQQHEIEQAKAREIKYRQIYDQILKLINHRVGLKASNGLSFNVSFIFDFKTTNADIF